MEEAINMVVENVWSTYDVNNSGVLEKEEAMKFVRDSLGQMETGTTKYEYKESDFIAFFDELDKDHSGSIDKGEMFLFIKRVLNGEDAIAAVKAEPEKVATEAKSEKTPEQRA